MVKGVGLRLLSRRGSWVQIPPSAPQFFHLYVFLMVNLKSCLAMYVYGDVYV